jgi:hypothetical protein
VQSPRFRHSCMQVMRLVGGVVRLICVLTNLSSAAPGNSSKGIFGPGIHSVRFLSRPLLETGA